MSVIEQNIKLTARVLELEAEMKSRERAYQNTDTGWRNMNIADATRIEELEASLLASNTEANDLRQERDDLRLQTITDAARSEE